MKKKLSLPIVISLVVIILIKYTIFKKNETNDTNNAEKTAINNPKSSNITFDKITPNKNIPPLSKKPIFNNTIQEKALKNESSDDPDGKLQLATRIGEALELERIRTLDPALGYVPDERKQLALEQTRRMQGEMVYKSKSLRGAVNQARWKERGPGNVGGRVRAILVDMNDPTRQTLFAAGATGGLYRIEKINSPSARWVKINDYQENLTVSALGQDPTNPKTLYLGTGDVDTNLGSTDAKGNGIYKSIDGGITWTRLAATVGNNFANISSIDFNKKGHVFAGTFTGLYKSKDGGETWQKVLGAGPNFGDAQNTIWRVTISSNDDVYAAMVNRLYKSTNDGEAGTWENLSIAANGYPTGWNRTELALAPSDANILYVVGSINGRGTPVYQSLDGGKTWRAGKRPLWRDGGAPPSESDFTRGQAWYDLSLVVSPDNPYLIYVGGVDFFRSFDGGQVWQQMTSWSGTGLQYAHADQHGAMFEPKNPKVLYIGTDGGVFRIDNPDGTWRITEKTQNFVTTQFYGCAIHPDSTTNYFKAGAQDNGTIIVRSQNVDFNARKPLGGDGFLCFIDQDEPNIQIGSLYYGDWHLSQNGGISYSSGARSNGGFYCPADYDNKNNILYAQTNSGDLWRWKIGVNSGENVDLELFTTRNASVIHVDPNIEHRIYIGTNQGNLYRIDSANSGSLLKKNTSLGNFPGNISCIDIENGNPNHLILTISNYGVTSVYESLNGGTTWIDIEGNLPDMPVRWVLFNPNNARQAIIATDLGVWSSETLDSSRTEWFPPFPGKGIPLVRTDMLQMRQSDKMVLAATYGRGMWTTTMFSNPKAQIGTNGVAYVNIPVQLRGDVSNASEKYNWDFGDGTSDTIENPIKTFNKIGTYDLNLFINGDRDLKAKKTLKVLPQLNLPYQNSATNYDGSFEKADNDFGAYSEYGSKFERGKSNIAGKDGVKTGKNAYVLSPNDRDYQKNTEAYLYTPMFDMRQNGIYSFSFWSYYEIQKGYDGFQVEYSIDKGLSWQVLTSTANDINWYTYSNTTITDGAFPQFTSYFSGSLSDWTRFKVNISHLAGNENVAFRFVFKSDDETIVGNDVGVAIDDIEVSKYSGDLKTQITEQSGAFAFSASNAYIDIKFKTLPEYFAKTFEIELSENGKTTKEVIKMNAVGIVSAELQEYNTRFNNTTKDLYFIRIKSINEDSAKTTFYTDRFVVRKDNINKNGTLNVAFPSPFTNLLTVTFTDFIKEKVLFELFAVNGQKVYEETRDLNEVYADIKLPRLAKGIYLLSVKIGSNKPETVKVYGGF